MAKIGTMPVMLRIVVVVAALAALPVLHAEDKLCGKCKTTGRVPNPVVTEKWTAAEAGAIHCSAKIDKDPTACGSPFLVCRGCAAVALAQKAQAELDAYVAGEKAWLAERRKIDAVVKPRAPLVHVETEHFLLISGLAKVTLADRTVLDAHAAAHLYARRLEETYAWFLRLMGATDADMRVKKHQVFLMDDLRTLITAAGQYAQLPTDRAGRAVGDPSILTTWRDRAVFKTDEDFHRHVVHHVVHLFLGVFFQKIWLVERAGFLEEGVSHVAEMELFKKSGNSCNLEGSEQDMADEDWEPIVRKLAAAGPPLTFAELAPKKAHVLTPAEHYLAWSFTDYLWKLEPKKLRELVIALKQDKPLRDALRELYGVTIVGIDASWKAWVLEHYRLKPAGA